MKRTLLLFISLFFAVSLYSQITLTTGTNTDATPVIDRASNIVHVATTGSWNMSYARLSPLVSGTYTITTVSTAALFGSQWVYASLYGDNDASVQFDVSTGDQTGPAGDLDEVTISAYLSVNEVYFLGLGVTLEETIGLNIESPVGGGLLGFVWTGSSNTDWSTTSNWNWDTWRLGNALPKAWNNVTISGTGSNPVIGATAQAECNNITVDGGASLTIESGTSGTGSLIVHGTATGQINAQRSMTGNTWHVVSGAVSGQDVSSFLTSNSNIPTKTGGYRGMTDYNTSGNAWNAYFTAGSGTIEAGKGYLVRTDADGYVTFTGSLTTGNKTVSVSDDGEGWNCIGNPYSSAINMNTAASASSNFLATNSANLDPSYACVYVWEGSTSSYKILGNSSFGVRDLGQNVFPAGQGFFVKVATGVSSVQFNSSMQTHLPSAVLKSANVTWPYFTINATSGQTKASTVVAFNNEMTKGLDPTYDAGLLRGSNGLSLYSRLVDDNGVDFAIQCLPEQYSNLVIPVGLDSKAGGEIIFSAQSIGLPSGSSVILEDKTTGSLTSLSEGATYKAMVAANSQGIGRFYIHTSNLTTGVEGLVPNGDSRMKVYQVGEQLIIEGVVGNQAKASLYNTTGVNLGQYNLSGGSTNSISVAGFPDGIYLVKVADDGKQYNFKAIIK